MPVSTELLSPPEAGKQPQSLGATIAIKCVEKGIPCVICTAVPWKEKEDEDIASKEYGVPTIGHKDWERALEKLQELIATKKH